MEKGFETSMHGAQAAMLVVATIRMLNAVEDKIFLKDILWPDELSRHSLSDGSRVCFPSQGCVGSSCGRPEGPTLVKWKTVFL